MMPHARTRITNIYIVSIVYNIIYICSRWIYIAVTSVGIIERPLMSIMTNVYIWGGVSFMRSNFVPVLQRYQRRTQFCPRGTSVSIMPTHSLRPIMPTHTKMEPLCRKSAHSSTH